MNNIVVKLDLKNELRNLINKENQYTIPIFIPHKGCKNSCVFCNQHKISGALKDVTPKEIDEIIKEYLGYFEGSSKNIEIAFFGGSFTGLDYTMQKEYLEVANKYVKLGKVSGIRLSTRPDYISSKILKLLKINNVKTIELGVQSLDDEVLFASKRGHSKLDVIRASRLIQGYGFNLGHQIMIGLPNSTLEKEITTIEKVIKINPKELRIYPVYVISPSELYDMYIENKYEPLSLEEAINRTYNVVKKLEETDIKVIRMGLQSTDEICSKNDKIVGPVCDNFAEYVFARIIRDSIEEEIKNKIRNEKEKEINEICILVPSKYISLTIGPKKINKKYFKEKYNIDLIVKGEL